jgi:hypothetical protein
MSKEELYNQAWEETLKELVEFVKRATSTKATTEEIRILPAVAKEIRKLLHS